MGKKKEDGWYLGYTLRDARGRFVKFPCLRMKAKNRDEADDCVNQILVNFYAEQNANGLQFDATDIFLMEYKGGKMVFCEETQLHDMEE